MIAAYRRVSSRGQDLGAQRTAIELAARARKHRIAKWFDEKQSGASLARPVLAELRDAVRQGKVRTLYVFRLDRLTRSGIRDTVALLEELRGAGCSVISVADGFDPSGPGAELVAACLAWAAQMERAALGERISAARARARERGEAWGRPRRADAELVAKVRARAGKQTQRAIARALRVPLATVSAIINGKGPYARARSEETGSSPSAKKFAGRARRR